MHSRSLRTSGALARTKMSVRPAGPGPSPEGVPRDHHPPLPPREHPGTPRPRPLPQFPRNSPLLRLAAPTGWAGAVTRGRRGGARTPRESSGGAALEGQARALLLRALAAPSQPRPPRHLSCGSCASPSRAAASLRPPSSLLPQSPLRLRRTASARPPTAAVDWLSPPRTGSWRQHSLGTLTVRTDSPASY